MWLPAATISIDGSPEIISKGDEGSKLGAFRKQMYPAAGDYKKLGANLDCQSWIASFRRSHFPCIQIQPTESCREPWLVAKSCRSQKNNVSCTQSRSSRQLHWRPEALQELEDACLSLLCVSRGHQQVFQLSKETLPTFRQFFWKTFAKSLSSATCSW